jgi:hypothetical protein
MKGRVGLLVGVLGLAALTGVACSDDDGDSANTTTTANQGFQVETPDGQASLSLSGSLPPNWPDDFPIPSGAEPAGSGSLGGSSSTGFIGVYSTSQSPSEVFSFYTSDTSLTVTSSGMVGSIGTVEFSGEFNGWVVTLPYQDETLIVVYLSQSTTGTTTGGSGSGTTTGA